MSIPLDRLYTFLQDIVKTDIVIYRWSPHGSKKLTDLSPMADFGDKELKLPGMIAHDQEPINYAQYTRDNILEWKQQIVKLSAPELKNIPDDELVKDFQAMNVKKFFDIIYKNRTMFFLHSEKQSSEVTKLSEIGYIPVYVWSHALIARDWYRYAEHDPALKKHNFKRTFLIYNRAWSGTREYRLKFAELLVKNNLTEFCKMGFNPIDDDFHYHTHCFKNSALSISVTDIENYFFLNTSNSNSSADYCSADYQETKIEVVLETLFDDKKWHLTEKVLRPIACGHPFILASTPGALKYLRSYGFETFGELIDETYDDIKDPVQRLISIIESMKQFLRLSESQYKMIKKIAEKNKQIFFSAEFQQLIVKEFLENFDQAILTITPSQSSAGGLSS